MSNTLPSRPIRWEEVLCGPSFPQKRPPLLQRLYVQSEGYSSQLERQTEASWTKTRKVHHVLKKGKSGHSLLRTQLHYLFSDGERTTLFNLKRIKINTQYYYNSCSGPFLCFVRTASSGDFTFPFKGKEEATPLASGVSC